VEHKLIQVVLFVNTLSTAPNRLGCFGSKDVCPNYLILTKINFNIRSE